MFTGIIEEIGTVQGVKKGVNFSALSISGYSIFGDLKIGDSVAVNGVCLTVSGLAGKTFTADVMHETLTRSATGSLKAGSRVNLERALPADGRFGGHIVSGHIDGTGTIVGVKPDGNAVLYKIMAPGHVMKYIVEKGSVAVDGISLTVTEAAQGWFGVSVIPHTLKATALAGKSSGDEVNLECDIIGKYVEKLMRCETAENQESGITMEFLAKFGYTGG
ncbi:MAG: riboflavin synthase [Clostridiales bacterium]|nr:riboflavin synthase [Clostridiales bacterium]